MHKGAQVQDLAETMKSLASAAELLGQERALHAVFDQLAVRGSTAPELQIFEKLVRERLEYTPK